jgi:flagellar L-ring protein precursor FlgH
MDLRKIYIFLLLFALFLPGCNLARNLATVGEPPQMTQIKDPRDVPGYEPVHMAMPDATPPKGGSTNSLWQSGSRAFFKDQRAGKVGDVLSVEVLVDRKQYMQMNPDIERQSSLSTTVNELFGQSLPVQKRMAKALPGQKNSAPKPLTTWADVTSSPAHKSTAKYDVQDKMQFNMAVVVIQILPNGNMVIQGREEVRLVNELREIEIKGIIRREDISSNNTIASQKIAQLRISYGGRGDLSDAQQAPWGQQYLNKLLPF